MTRLMSAMALLTPFWLQGQVPGVPNFHQVSDGVYRGGQPSIEGFRSLAKLGVKVVIDLRHQASQARSEQGIVEAQGMKFLSVPMTMHAPTDAQVSRVLETLYAGNGPVFVHCQGGRDRTGTIIACYRIAHDGWDSQKALVEAKTDGMRGRDIGMRKYVRKFRGMPASLTVLQPTSAANVTVP